MNIKAIRKSIREAAKDMKTSTFDKNSCVDVGGRKWVIEYSVYYWREASETWGNADWDDYGTSGTQKGMIKDLEIAHQDNPEWKLCAVVSLMCEGKINQQKMFDLDGKEIKNES